MSTASSKQSSFKLYQCDPCESEGKQHGAEYHCINCEENLCSSCRDNHQKFQKLRDHEIQQLSANPSICKPCKSNDIVREARFFCDNCDEYMCNTCKDVHNKFKKLREHTVLDIQERKQQGMNSKHTGPSLGNNILVTGCEEATELHAQPSDGSRASRVLDSTVPSLDTLTLTEPQHATSPTNQSDLFSIINTSFQSVQVVNMKSSEEESMRIHGCAIMPDGQVLLVNNYESEVLQLDAAYTIRDRLKVPALEITAIKENVAVVVGGGKINFLNVKPKLHSVRSVSLDESIRGVAAGGGLIYISCNKGDDDNGRIRVLTGDGKEIRRIEAIRKGHFLFDKPYHLVASKTKVYLSGETLTCLKPDGTLVYQYKDENLGKVAGICVDSADNAIACAYGSKVNTKDKFHMIGPNGRMHTHQSSKTALVIPGYNCSDCIAIRPCDKTLIMGSFDKLYIFQMT